MTIKEYLQNKLPKRTIEIDTTYPGSIMIFIDSVSFPLFPKTNNFEALWKTLQTYCLLFEECLDGNSETIIDNVIKDITSINNTEAYVDLNDLNKLATVIENIIADRLKQSDADRSLAQLALLQKIANELRFDNATEALGLANDTTVTLAINNHRKVFKFEKYFIKHLNDYFANFNMSIMPGDCLFEVKLRIVDPFYLPKQYQIIKLNDHLRNLIITTPESKWDQLLSAFDKVAFQIIHNQINQITDDINHFYDQRKNITFESREQQRHAALLKFYTMLNL